MNISQPATKAETTNANAKATSQIHLIETGNTYTNADGQELPTLIELEVLWQDNSPNHPNIESVALLCHPNPLHGGSMTNKVVSTMWRFARDNNCHVVRFNFRGVGKSTGEHDYAKGEIEDALCVLQWIADNSSADKLWLGGFSFGGYVAARVAEQVVYYPHIWGLDFELTNLALIAPSVVNNDTADLQLPNDVTFQIHGDSDEVVCPIAMREFAKRMQIRMTTVPDVGHFFHGNLDKLKQALIEQTN